MTNETELSLLQKIEHQLRNNKDTLLTDLIPDNCNCAKGKMKRVFRCPEAFTINSLLEQLDRVRSS